MKITSEQRNAASLFWTQILTDEMSSSTLNASKRQEPPVRFIHDMAVRSRNLFLEKITNSDPTWAIRFMNALDDLLIDADITLYLALDYQPQGLLENAATIANIPKHLFPKIKLNMTFDNQGNILVSGQTINAKTFLEDAAKNSSTRARL